MLTTKLKKWGNGQGVRLSKDIISMMEINVEDSLEVIIEDDQIVLKKIIPTENRLTIDELFKNYSGHNDVEPVDFGDAVGDEIW